MGGCSPFFFWGASCFLKELPAIMQRIHIIILINALMCLFLDMVSNLGGFLKLEDAILKYSR